MKPISVGQPVKKENYLGGLHVEEPLDGQEFLDKDEIYVWHRK